MLSFTGGLSDNCEGFLIFINEKYEYRDSRNLLPKDMSEKIDSFIEKLKNKKIKDEVNVIDVNEKKKCFIVKIENKYEDYYPEELGATFYSYVNRFNHINFVDLLADSFIEEKKRLIRFMSKFIFGLNLKSYKFSKYKTIEKQKLHS